jgi:hypothetical protein
MKSTKLLYLIVLIIGLLSSCGFTASNMTRGGFYIAGLDYLYCTSELTCIHEHAHRMDAQRGFISSTPEYQLAIQSYAMNNPGKLWSSQILNYRGSMSEMYAQMYESVSGKIDLLPIELRRFYY